MKRSSWQENQSPSLVGEDGDSMEADLKPFLVGCLARPLREKHPQSPGPTPLASAVGKPSYCGHGLDRTRREQSIESLSARPIRSPADARHSSIVCIPTRVAKVSVTQDQGQEGHTYTHLMSHSCRTLGQVKGLTLEVTVTKHWARFHIQPVFLSEAPEMGFSASFTQAAPGVRASW